MANDAVTPRLSVGEQNQIKQPQIAVTAHRAAGFGHLHQR
jgi:hypothetical protein